MRNCIQCSKETNSDLYAKELNGYLCGRCSNLYIGLKKGELNKKIKVYQNKINDIEKLKQELDEKINNAIMADCKHVNKTSTGLLKPKDGNMLKEYICEDCNKTIYVERAN